MQKKRSMFTQGLHAAALTVALATAAAWAQAANDWTAFATVSPTTTLSAGHLCYTDGRDIACPSTAPTFDAATGLLSIDRITSGTTGVTANSTNYISITNAGTTTGYFDSTGRLITPGISVTTNQTSVTSLYASGNVKLAGTTTQLYSSNYAGRLYFGSGNQWYLEAAGTSTNTATFNLIGWNGISYQNMFMTNSSGLVGVGTSSPTATLQVSGSFTVSTTGQTTTPTLYANTSGNVGIGTSAPSQSLVVQASTPVFRLESTAAPANYYTEFTNQYNSNEPFFIKVGGSTTKIIGQKTLNGPAADTYLEGYYGISFITNAIDPTLATVRMYISNTGLVGIGTVTPTTKLDVSGTLRLSDGGETCTSTTAGAIKYTGGQFYFCNASSWQTLAAAAAAGGIDNITSSTTKVTVNGTSQYISFTNGGTVTGYIDSTGRLITPGISVTTNQTSVTSLYASGKIGVGTTTPNRDIVIEASTPILRLQTRADPATYYTELITQYDATEPFYIYTALGKTFGVKRLVSGGAETFVNGYHGLSFNTSSGDPTLSTVRMYISSTGLVGIATTAPSTTFHVSGTLRLADGGEACDTNRAGAIKYTGGQFYFCNASSWQTIGTIAAGGIDNITSSTTKVTVNGTSTYISFTNGGTVTGYIDSTGRLITPGISVTTNQTSVTSLYASGNVGIGTSSLNNKLAVVGGTVMFQTAGGVQTTFNAGISINNNLYLDTAAGSNADILFRPNTATAMTIKNTSGYVGIGTTDPSFTLTVKGAYASPQAMIGYDGSNGIFFQAQGNSTHYNWLVGQQRSTGTALEFTPSTAMGGRTFTNPAMVLLASGYVGISNTNPVTTLDISGTLRISDAGTSCNSTTAGAIKYTGGSFYFCAGSAWQTLAAAAAAGGIDNITSSTTKVTVNGTSTYISFTNGGTVTGYIDSTGRLITPGISVTTNQTSVTSLYASGNVGIGIAAPSQPFEVRGRYGSPATSGASQNGIAAFSSTDTYGTLYVGNAGTSPWSMWLQSAGRNDLSVNYPLSLNPNGGNVGIGTISPYTYSGYTTLEVSGTNGGMIRAQSGAVDSAVEIFHANTYGSVRTSGTYPLYFGVASSTKMNLGTSGFLAIGKSTTAADSPLEVYRNDATVYDATATDGQIGGGATLTISNPASGNTYFTQLLLKGRYGNNGRLLLTGGATPAVAIVTSGTETLRLGQSSGSPRLSIGTTASTYALEISDSSVSNRTLALRGSSPGIALFQHSTEAALIRQSSGSGLVMSANGGYHLFGYDYTHTGFRFYNGNSTEQMRLDASGNLGIGTTAPSVALQVSGAFIVSSSFQTTSPSIYVSATSGKVGFGTTTLATTGKITVGRVDTTSEGGEIALARSSDNAHVWSLDVFGSTAGPLLRFVHETSGTAPFVISNQDYVGINNTNPSYVLDVTGIARFTGNYTTSDARLKTNVNNLNYGLADVMKLRPVFFDWKKPVKGEEGRRVGFIAQEVEKVIPEIVSTASDPSQTKAVEYGNLTPILAKAIQELKAENDQLKAQNEQILQQLQSLQKQIQAHRP